MNRGPVISGIVAGVFVALLGGTGSSSPNVVGAGLLLVTSVVVYWVGSERDDGPDWLVRPEPSKQLWSVFFVLTPWIILLTGSILGLLIMWPGLFTIFFIESIETEGFRIFTGIIGGFLSWVWVFGVGSVLDYQLETEDRVFEWVNER